MSSRTAKIYLDMLDIVKSIPSNSTPDYPYFIYSNIWDNQIDQSVLANNYAFNCPACFIEVDLGEGTQWMNGMTSFPDAIMSYHIYFFLLDGGNDTMEQNLIIFTIKDLLKSKTLGATPSKCSPFQVCADVQDFKHKGVYKYVLSFRTNFIDDKGSNYDPLGIGQTFGFLTNGTMNLNYFKLWQSDNDYSSGLNAVVYDGKIYLCVVSNSDTEFDPDKWEEIPVWTPQHYIVSDLAAFESGIFECTVENTDAVFNPSNWNKIY